MEENTTQDNNKENIEKNTTQDNNVDNYKHIVLCVDQTPSMSCEIQGGTIIEAVNKGVTAFINVFKEKKHSANIISLTFDSICQINPGVDVKQFKPKYSVEKVGKAHIADALNTAAENLLTYQGKRYVIFISDGVVGPDEDEKSLTDAINKLHSYFCRSVGFSGSAGDTSLYSLLDYYTNKQIVSFNDQKRYIETLQAIAQEIILPKDTNDSDSKGNSTKSDY